MQLETKKLRSIISQLIGNSNKENNLISRVDHCDEYVTGSIGGGQSFVVVR